MDKVTTTIIGIVLGGGVVATTILMNEKPVEQPTERVKTSSEKVLDAVGKEYARSTIVEKQVADTVLSLYDRRAKGDEPSIEEWRSAEQSVDELRNIQDSPRLQKLDRMLEVSDAQNQVIETETNKL